MSLPVTKSHEKKSLPYLKLGRCRIPLQVRAVGTLDLIAHLLPDSCRCNKLVSCSNQDGSLRSGRGYAHFRINFFPDFPTAQLQFFVSYSKLSSRVIGVTLRGPAQKCWHSAGVLIQLGVLGSAIQFDIQNWVSGGTYLILPLVMQIVEGKSYVVVRTERFPECGGEIAGRLVRGVNWC